MNGRTRLARAVAAAAAVAAAGTIVAQPARPARAADAPAAAAAPAPIAAPRVAVIVGNDVGGPGDTRLRYAEADARRIADILTTVGGVAGADAVVVRGRSADEVRAAIRAAEARLLRAGGEGLLFVYYSGHADAETLHLGGSALPVAELQAMLRSSAVATRVLVIDACRSGALTLTKGGRPAGSFDAHFGGAPNPRGLAIITSSAAGEEAQESDELGASFFTHHLGTALVGAADADRDGAVTLAEAFTYAARHTAAATATTWAGPQHPTYRVDLGGRDELVLTRPHAASVGGGGGGAGAGGAARMGLLALHEPGSYLVRREGEGSLTAEISGDAVDRPLALAAGRYEVIRRASDHLMTGTFTVAAASSTAVTSAGMRRIEYGRAVRKGGTTTSRAFGLYAGGAVRGSVLGLGGALGGGMGGRLDLRGLSVTAGLDLAGGDTVGERGTRLSTTELGLRAGLYRAFDAAPRLTVAMGAELGVSRLAQSASEQSLARTTAAATGGPALLLEVPLWSRTFIHLQAAMPFYLMNVEDDSRTSSSLTLRPTYRLALVAGAYL
jgi:hypothetical protein